MKQKNQELKEITIKSDFVKLDIRDPEVLKKFRNAFLGVTPFSEECIIKNIDDIQLRLNKNTQEMFATAKGAIIVINKALGYIIEYDLQHFSMSPGKRYFYGKAFFQGLNEKELSDEVLTLRENAYYGSVTHFLRSVYNNTNEIEGFEIRSIERKINTEKQRALARLNTLDQAQKRSFLINKTMNLFGDSSDYIRKLLFERDYLPDVLSPNLVKAEAIKGVNEKGETIFKSPDTLLAVIHNKPLLPVMRRFVNRSGAFKLLITSGIRFVPNKEIVLNAKVNVISNGLGLDGFFSFAYGISTMLPENYEP
ncbi:hypothetical protein [Pedobacter frigoris]|uniref:Uncharacterized protein n=1 Tax=Pedobacter frigoris TaxID=2571272 RepID=A0A4U1CAK0_9SPHI|nr:hypothetical protein [Pedobacter frigoris]TKC02858.1 hypothetical protein FA047_20100 [Pedobacter frigoris]